MKFAELSGYLPNLERTIRRYYQREIRAAPTRFRPHLRLLEQYTLRGGKRLRALLVLGGYHLATRKDPAPAISAAAALEMFQSWMLIHDDIIDHSEQRRGGPTLHRAVEARHRTGGWAGAAEEYGVGMGITLGDLQEPLTVGALLDSPVSPERRIAALREYVRMTQQTAYGQILDIENGLSPIPSVRESDVLLVHRLKSAVYTVAAPLRLGAMLGGGSSGLLRDLEVVGLDLGVAFQLRDDVLGAGFESASIGKSANDLLEGKRTLLVVHAWAKADEGGRALLTRVLGNPAATAEDANAVRDLLTTTGSVAYSERMIARLRDRATRRFERSRSMNAAGRSLLREVAEKLLYRRL